VWLRLRFQSIAGPWPSTGRDVFRRVQPDGDFGLYYGGERRPDARVVFASVQTLARRLDTFAPDAFDYVVVDEFHHAAAASSRKVLDHFTPAFLLGLTATPERMDGADLLALCGDHLVYQCDLVEGIRRQELVPFSYWGVADSVDFTPIPGRNARFDPDALSRAVETNERAQQAVDEWRARAGSRTLAFCVSTRHADFMAEFFTAHGVACAAAHSGPTSAPRHQAGGSSGPSSPAPALPRSKLRSARSWAGRPEEPDPAPTVDSFAHIGSSSAPLDPILADPVSPLREARPSPRWQWVAPSVDVIDVGEGPPPRLDVVRIIADRRRAG